MKTMSENEILDHYNNFWVANIRLISHLNLSNEIKAINVINTAT